MSLSTLLNLLESFKHFSYLRNNDESSSPHFQLSVFRCVLNLDSRLSSPRISIKHFEQALSLLDSIIAHCEGCRSDLSPMFGNRSVFLLVLSLLR